MAKPAFIRYLPARLKPLGNPAVWVPLTVISLVGMFAWEYSRNPEWFSREPITSFTPDSQLTPEEEARLSEIDTLDVLLNGSRAPEGTAPVTSQINPDAPDAGKQSADEGDSSEIDLSAYPIPGAASTTTTLAPSQPSVFSDPSQPTTRTAAGSNGSSFNFGDGLANTAAPSPSNSALAEALAQREAELATLEQSPAGGSDIRPLGEAFRGQSGVGNGGVGVDAAPGAATVPGSFIRTTPEMSPPVGTTGYQVPATSSLPTFNVAPPQPTRSPFSAPANAGQFAVPTPTGQAVPAPATVAAPVIGGPGSAPSSGLYTQPSSVQPDQGPAINPRR